MKACRAVCVHTAAMADGANTTTVSYQHRPLYDCGLRRRGSQIDVTLQIGQLNPGGIQHIGDLLSETEMDRIVIRVTHESRVCISGPISRM